MPKYRFVITNGDESTDLVDLPNLERARIEAVRTLGDFLRHDAEDFWETGACRIVVQDEQALTLFEIDAVGVEAPAARRMA